MRKLVFILGFLVTVSANLKAQPLQDFSGSILKDQEKKPEMPLRLTDFSYRGAYSVNGASFMELPQENPGVAFLASALIPGSGQAANGKWIRAGVYFAVDVVGAIFYLDKNSTARRQERNYEQFTHENWSVLAYAEWLVNYSQINNLDNGFQQLQNHIAGKSPNFENTTSDWSKVNLALLHEVENRTPFILEGGARRSEFSHELPKYGSQQYYELISKYYQYQPGWQDWYIDITTNPNAQSLEFYQYMWNGDDEPNTLFYMGRDMARQFNDNYRTAGNILKLLLVNHVVSAFDAYFTVKLKNSRIEPSASLIGPEQISLSWHF